MIKLCEETNKNIIVEATILITEELNFLFFIIIHVDVINTLTDNELRKTVKIQGEHWRWGRETK